MGRKYFILVMILAVSLFSGCQRAGLKTKDIVLKNDASGSKESSSQGEIEQEKQPESGNVTEQPLSQETVPQPSAEQGQNEPLPSQGIERVVCWEIGRAHV